VQDARAPPCAASKAAISSNDYSSNAVRHCYNGDPIGSGPCELLGNALFRCVATRVMARREKTRVSLPRRESFLAIAAGGFHRLIKTAEYRLAIMRVQFISSRVIILNRRLVYLLPRRGGRPEVRGALATVDLFASRRHRILWIVNIDGLKISVCYPLPPSLSLSLSLSLFLSLSVCRWN